MGYEKSKRPVIAPSFTASTQLASNIWGNILLTGDLTLPTEAKTLSTAAQTLSDDGVSFVTYGTSGKPSDAILPDPPHAGAVKFIFLVNNTTSIEANINPAATANTFWGTTFNTATVAAASTGSPGGTPAASASLVLVGQSTDQWAVLPGSTFNWDFTATTGSTATA